MFRSLVIAAALTAIAAADPVPAIDAKALEPILSHSWAAGSCEAPTDIVDWVIDIDGTPFERHAANGGYTPLSTLSFANGTLTLSDEVGIGTTTTTYQQREDGALRLWSISYVGEETPEPEVTVQDGKNLTGDDGQKLATPVETPALHPCPPRTQLFSTEAVTALGGVWVEAKGGSCAKGTNAMMFDFARPIPTLSFGPTAEAPSYDYWILDVTMDAGVWTVTAGASFEASLYHFAIGKDGSLSRTDDTMGAPILYKRCPT